MTPHMPEDRLAEAVSQLPPTWRGQYFESVESTQDEARAAAGRGAPAPSVFVADYQRAGRGRQGRTWLARPCTALMMSILFRERAARVMPFRYTCLASLGVVEAIDQLRPGLDAAIKWPNDV